MGILKRWRQFGRRYFWPHLLLGVVAASFGVPCVLASGQEPSHQSGNFSNLSRANALHAGFTHLALFKDAGRRPSFGVDYWHQHAIRTVIRHLSIAWVPQHVISAQDVASEANLPLSSQHQVLLSSLSALLNHQPVAPRQVKYPLPAGGLPLLDQRTGIRLAQVQGIRAGPVLA